MTGSVAKDEFASANMDKAARTAFDKSAYDHVLAAVQANCGDVIREVVTLAALQAGMAAEFFKVSTCLGRLTWRPRKYIEICWASFVQSQCKI